jgi:aspartyl-tRNA(Asn)/glutamyl-tRNA(Gln) amidotransferase subunit B
MEQGSLRCDVNVSVRKEGETLGTRCEIKNLNSVRFVMQAIQVEARRQVEEIENGNSIIQQTRLFDSVKGETRPMRSKEDAHDYRYFPDPDLMPLELTHDFIDEIQKSLPSLPDDIREELVDDFGLSNYDASVISEEKETADFFFAASKGQDGKLVSNWLTTELFGYLNKKNLSLKNSPITPSQLGQLVGLISDGTISGRIAKDVFVEMFEKGQDASVIIEKKNMKQNSNINEIEMMIEKIIEQNADKVIEYKNGKDKLFGFFVGQVMKESGGKANPKIVNQILKEKLN